MPLSDADAARLYSDAFQRNSKAQLGESAFACADLKTQLDVAGYANGVLQDELTAAQKASEAWQATASRLFATANNVEAGRVSPDPSTPGGFIIHD